MLGHRSVQWRARVLAMWELTRPQTHRGALAHRGNVTMGALAVRHHGADDGARGLRKQSEPGRVRHHPCADSVDTTHAEEKRAQRTQPHRTGGLASFPREGPSTHGDANITTGTTWSSIKKSRRVIFFLQNA